MLQYSFFHFIKYDVLLSNVAVLRIPGFQTNMHSLFSLIASSLSPIKMYMNIDGFKCLTDVGDSAKGQ